MKLKIIPAGGMVMDVRMHSSMNKIIFIIFIIVIGQYRRRMLNGNMRAEYSTHYLAWTAVNRVA
ncbi:hypothetical protein [Janthinobacterium sp. HH107]|uniref:hypothetical protein n=1 Tax=Janthinobacterium sp. HH107 TaxID=1537279 RepID=UPI00114CEDA2|nr:hypothetical protein [Janthinobacterium sp. HH107]